MGASADRPVPARSRTGQAAGGAAARIATESLTSGPSAKPSASAKATSTLIRLPTSSATGR